MTREPCGRGRGGDGGGREAPTTRGTPQPDLPDLVDPIAETLAALRRKGFGRLFVDGQAVDARRRRSRDAARIARTLQVVVDRVKVDGDLRARLTDSIETAYREGGGAAFAIELAADARRAADRASCSPSGSSAATCGIAYETPQPRLFSFNNPFGACPTCHGFGNIIELDMDLVVPDPSKSIQQGAIEPWSKPHYRAQLAELKRAARRRAGLRLDVPWARPDRRREAVRRRRRRRRATKASAASSAGSSGRSTRCTSACSSAATAAT